MKDEFKLSKKNQTLSIFPFSDVHYGSPYHNNEFFEFMLKKFKNTTGEKIIYLVGDECDVAVKRQANSAYEQKINLNEQMEYIIKSYKPFRKHIRGIVQSNHMARTKKEMDIDISKVIADSLDIPYKNNIYETLTINDKPYNVYVTHGSKTSGQLHLQQGATQRSTDHIEANLVLYGHAHYTNSWSIPRKTLDGYKRKHYVLCGHFLKYEGSYAERMGLRPNPCGFTKVNVDGKLRTTVDLYHEDECTTKYLNRIQQNT